MSLLMNRYGGAIERVQLTDIISIPAKVLDPDAKINTSGPEWEPWVYKPGLDKWMESEISSLSVGQRQLVCLCRAFLWNRKMLTLDEATANVDSNTDRIMQEVIREELKSCTPLTIAHRLNTAMDSGRILVMDNGKVAEVDTPQSLLSRDDSIISSLYECMNLNSGD